MLNQSSSGDPIRDILISVIGNLVTELLKAGGNQLDIAVLGTREEQAYRRAFISAFERMFELLPPDVTPESVDSISYALHQFVSDDEVAGILLDIALRVRETPIHMLRTRFFRMGFDATSIRMDFDEGMNAFVNGLGEGLRAESEMPDSPLYNRVSQELLRALLQELRDLKEQLPFQVKQAKLEYPKQMSQDTLELLPLTLTRLIGRKVDLTKVRDAIRQNRLVTITGVGGVGKTALAQNVARIVHEEEKKMATPRSVLYVALDALSSGRKLADYVRRKLLPDSPPPADADERSRQEDTVRVIANALNKGGRLLVLDNFETALDDIGAALALDFVRNLIAATNDQVRFLVTSRRALDLIPIETGYPLEPLEEKYAIDLFYERAGDAISADDRPTVAEICRLEDYLPLGIELAAAAIQQKRRPLKEMLEALRVTPLDVDIANTLGYPERQRGLIATFRYTFEHLSTEAQRLFCAFSVFRGGADRDAVKYVDGTDAWEKALGELVNWKLLNVDTARELWRYSMLATTDAFSKWALNNYGMRLELNENELKQRQANYYVPLVNRLTNGPRGIWYEFIEDFANMSFALDNRTFQIADAFLRIDARDAAKNYAMQILIGYETLGLEKDAARVRTWMRENGIE